MSTNRNPNQPRAKSRKVSVPNEVLWALIGLLLTILGTFVEASTLNPPWNWAQQGVKLVSLDVTFQVGAVLLTGCLGGKNAGALSQIAYIVIGLFWLPVFALGGGVSYFTEPSFGYVLGFIPGAWLCGAMAFRQRATLEWLVVSAMVGLLVIHLCGLVYLLGLSFVFPNTNLLVTPDNLPAMLVDYSINPFPAQLAIACVVALLSLILRQILFY